jgi:glyoxylase-like metal-dependent hydrolase (beta-lactamase superfamily II)/8-oxo-dGTP pyrophosphatase MutT (NUDIX family)
MNQPNQIPAATPKDAAAVILLRHNTEANDPQFFWARRNIKLAFMGGFHAFPGGQRDETDAQVKVENCDDATRATMIACAARELFEETGVLIVQGGAALTKGQRASLLDDLISERMSFADVLVHYGLYLDARDFTFAGRWVTPAFSPRRFDTWFFLVHCPQKQNPQIEDEGELESGEWIAASEALSRWHQSKVIIAPPVRHAIETLADGLTDDLVERFLSIPQTRGNSPRRIEFRPGFINFPVRSPTVPPATHTNCYIVGGRELVILDPASPYEDEQAALTQCVDELIDEGRTIREIILTHLHPDHVGGVNALVQHLGNKVPVAAHRLTSEALKNEIEVTRLIEDEELITLEGMDYIPTINLKALHTPGHARGHLCFYEETTGALITGDNIVGLGSVLINPPEGNMKDYLASLERIRSLPHLTILFGAHGPAMGNPRAKIDEYILHRLERESKILNAIREGARDIKEIVERVYTDVHPKALPMAERATLAHLEKLEADGFVSLKEERYFPV